jgi:hypothetical protein
MNYIKSQFMIIKEWIEIGKKLFEKNQIYCVN